MVQVECCGVWARAETRVTLCVLVACATAAQLQAASTGPYRQHAEGSSIAGPLVPLRTRGGHLLTWQMLDYDIV